MSRSLDQSRPFRAGRHRAEAAPVTNTPLSPTSSDAEVPNPGPAPTEPASAVLRRRRNRRPAFEVPPAPESARTAEAASPAIEALPAIARRSPAPESAARDATAATRRAGPRRGAVEKPADATSAAAPSGGPAILSPQTPVAFSSEAQAVLRRAASVRVMGHRMAVVAGALAVLLAVGTASQANELRFFGEESSVQDAAGATDPTRATSGTHPAYNNGRATSRPSASTPPGTPGAGPAQAPGTDDRPAAADAIASALPAVTNLPMPVDASTLAGILAASPVAVPPSPAPSVKLEPPVMSSATPAPPTAPGTAPPAPAPGATGPTTAQAPAATAPTATPAPAAVARTDAPAPASAPAPTPTTASPTPSPTTGAAAPDERDGTSEEAVETRSYASSRLASYGWGAEQMNALDALWDTSTKWRPSQVDRGLSYIKKRHGSPAKALEFRAANNWY